MSWSANPCKHNQRKNYKNCNPQDSSHIHLCLPPMDKVWVKTLKSSRSTNAGKICEFIKLNMLVWTVQKAWNAWWNWVSEVGRLPYFPLQSSKAATQHCSLHRNNDCNEVNRCTKTFRVFLREFGNLSCAGNSCFNFWNLCWGPLGLLGQCFLFLPVRTQWDRRKARATSCNRICKW